nr:MAG TPA: hypothetical protein [Bacteriophage sp.]
MLNNVLWYFLTICNQLNIILFPLSKNFFIIII